MLENEIEECSERLLEALAFLRTEFLRVISKHGLGREDITTALAGLAVGAIDSLSAAILALFHFDLSTNGAMTWRFEEHFALMFYFAACDNGEMLSDWFKNPEKVLIHANHNIWATVDARATNFFKHNPGWSFESSFRTASAESVHATWASVMHSLSWASGRYGLATPEAKGLAALAEELKRGRTVLVLGTMGPSVSRFIEFLQKVIFKRPEFSDVSPGEAYLSDLERDIFQWWNSAERMLAEHASQSDEASDVPQPGTSTHQNEEAKGREGEDLTAEDEAGAFESETERLDWLIQQIEEKVRRCGEPKVPPDLMEAFVVTSTWLNNALTHAKAILTLISQGLPDAVGPTQRALYELWIDWRFLLRHGDRNFNAAKVNINAMLEALESFEKQPARIDPKEFADARRRTREFELRYPEASAEVRTQRGRRKYHWSGISRSEMERTLGGSAFAYQFLSWDAHGTMGPIRDVSFKLSDGMAHFRFGRLETESSVKFCAWMNGGVLYYIYNDFARLWGLPTIVLSRTQGN